MPHGGICINGGEGSGKMRIKREQICKYKALSADGVLESGETKTSR